jgi:hypothetical protein
MPSSPTAVNDWLHLNLGGLPWEPLMAMGIRARMTMMQLRIRWKKHCKTIMDQYRMWRTEGIVLVSVKIGQYISDQ